MIVITVFLGENLSMSALLSNWGVISFL
jgi:hypothetical protein